MTESIGVEFPPSEYQIALPGMASFGSAFVGSGSPQPDTGSSHTGSGNQSQGGLAVPVSHGSIIWHTKNEPDDSYESSISPNPNCVAKEEIDEAPDSPEQGGGRRSKGHKKPRKPRTIYR